MSIRLTSEEIAELRKIDLFSYLKMTNPDELVHISKDTYCTRTHDSLIISNGFWNWFSRGFGGKNALDYLMKVENLSFLEAVKNLQPLTNININSLVYEIKTKTKKQKVGRKLIIPDLAPTSNNAKKYHIFLTIFDEI